MLQAADDDWQFGQSTLPFGWIGQTAEAVAARGVDMEGQLLALGIGAGADRLHARTQLTPAEYTLMCVRVINAVDDEMHGAARSRMRRGTASLGVKLFGTGRTLGESIVSLFRFFEIAGGFCHARLIRNERFAVVELHADGQPSDLTAVIEEMMATHLHMLFSYYLGMFAPLSQFTTTSPRHPNLGARHAYLGAVTVAGEATRMTFPASCLDLPARRELDDKGAVDAALHWLSCFEPESGHERWLDGGAELTRAVFSSLLSQDLTFEQCCAAIGVSPRAVRANLFAEGATYRQLRKAALIERVRPHLEAHANAEDMAIDLGYSDARSLRRALKSATGLSLREMRQPRPILGALPQGELIRNLRQEMAQMS